MNNSPFQLTNEQFRALYATQTTPPNPTGTPAYATLATNPISVGQQLQLPPTHGLAISNPSPGLALTSHIPATISVAGQTPSKPTWAIGTIARRAHLFFDNAGIPSIDLSSALLSNPSTHPLSALPSATLQQLATCGGTSHGKVAADLLQLRAANQTSPIGASGSSLTSDGVAPSPAAKKPKPLTDIELKLRIPPTRVKFTVELKPGNRGPQELDDIWKAVIETYTEGQGEALAKIDLAAATTQAQAATAKGERALEFFLDGVKKSTTRRHQLTVYTAGELIVRGIQYLNEHEEGFLAQELAELKKAITSYNTHRKKTHHKNKPSLEINLL